jgi:hypothetical protein
MNNNVTCKKSAFVKPVPPTLLTIDGIFAMDGHEDGIVSFAGNAETAAAIMINTLAYALELN